MSVAKPALARQRERSASSSARVRSQVMSRLSSIEIEDVQGARYGAKFAFAAVACCVFLVLGAFVFLNSVEAPSHDTVAAVNASPETLKNVGELAPAALLIDDADTLLTVSGRIDTPMRIAAENGKLVIRHVSKSNT